MAKVNEIVRTASGLIAIESVKARPEKLKQAIDYVKGFLKGEKVELQEFCFNEKPSLIVTPKGKKNAKLFFLIHLDVVEAEPKQFKPFVRNGKLFGRGSADMKASAAIALHVFKELSHARHSVGLIATTDEEIGGINGAGMLAGKVRPEFIIGTEPTEGHITIKHKGTLWLKIIEAGKACHGSMPWLGENAIEKLIARLHEIKALFKETTPKDRWKPTINIGAINGGDAPNRVPDRAEAKLDIRFAEGFDAKAFLKKLKKKGIKFEVIDQGGMLATSEGNELVKKLQAIYGKQLGKLPALSKEHGASDGKFFAGVPCVMLGLPGWNYHGLNEFIKLKDIPSIYKTYREFAEEF